MMYYFIVNPSSSSGHGSHPWKEVKHLLDYKNIPYHAAFTRKDGDASRLAAKASAKASSENPCTVVAVGGDGTANEVLNGLHLSPYLNFGYIPAGSGNDLAKGLGLPLDPALALDHILHPENIRPVRIGRTKTTEGIVRRFLISSGQGFDAAVCHDSHHSGTKNLLNRLGLGKLTYLATALQTLIHLKGTPASLTLDDGPAHFYDSTFFTAFMNMRYEGGGFMFCPDADPCDDYLDVCVVEKMPKLKVLLLLPTAFFGKHVRFSDVIHIYRCKKAVLRAETALHVHTDGEGLGPQKTIEVSLEPQTLSFLN